MGACVQIGLQSRKQQRNKRYCCCSLIVVSILISQLILLKKTKGEVVILLCSHGPIAQSPTIQNITKENLGVQRETQKSGGEISMPRQRKMTKVTSHAKPFEVESYCYFPAPTPDIPHFNAQLYVVSIRSINKCEYYGRQAILLSQRRVYPGMCEKDSDNLTKR